LARREKEEKRKALEAARRKVEKNKLNRMAQQNKEAQKVSSAPSTTSSTTTSSIPATTSSIPATTSSIPATTSSTPTTTISMPAATSSPLAETTPKKTYEDCTLQIKLLDGRAIQAQFKPTDNLRVVFNHISLLTGEKTFSLVTPYPRKVYSGAALDNTLLKDADLVPRGSLSVSR